MLVAVALFSFLLGSVPFGLLITRAMGLGDLRQIGSGNIGATNVLRTGSKPAALATLVCDVGKGAAAVVVARFLLGETAAQIAGVAAFAGHCYPIYLKFRGGKGVAAFLGTVLALVWPMGLAVCATWLIVAALTRISSLAALVAAALSPLYAVAFGDGTLAIGLAIMAAVIFLRHKTNIIRLMANSEPRIGEGK